MIGIDAVYALPLLLLFAVAAVYAILVFYSVTVLSARTCSVCGKTMPTDDSFKQHNVEHRPVVAGFTMGERSGKVRKAA
jgi:hypothetical protein